MKIGDYVRTKIGIISKVKEIHEVVTTDNEYITTLISHDNGTCGEENVIKYSQNIIDLIEEGDYVNDEKVIYVDKKHKYLEINGDEAVSEVIIEEKDIKSIVTKEQFEAMQYKVK